MLLKDAVRRELQEAMEQTMKARKAPGPGGKLVPMMELAPWETDKDVASWQDGPVHPLPSPAGWPPTFPSPGGTRDMDALHGVCMRGVLSACLIPSLSLSSLFLSRSLMCVCVCVCVWWRREQL